MKERLPTVISALAKVMKMTASVQDRALTVRVWRLQQKLRFPSFLVDVQKEAT